MERVTSIDLGRDAPSVHESASDVTMYKAYGTDEDCELLPNHGRKALLYKSIWGGQIFKSIVLFTALLLVALSIYQTILLAKPAQPGRRSYDSSETRKPRLSKFISCGKSVAEAKANGCTWDELSKAWLPRECPRYGMEEYRLQGMIANPHQNASTWPYYWDKAGTAELNFNDIAEDETRDIKEKIWTTSRQHLAHCAGVLKRTIWSYENGHGHYDAISILSHAHHCVDTLLRGAILSEGDKVDDITTLTAVHIGFCTFYEWE